MSRRSLKETQRQINENDPPIEVGQYWSIKSKGKILRRLRIVAEHPFPPFKEPGRAFIYEEHPSEMRRLGIMELGICPELNLRYVFDLERTD
jgi:hypothetical protein